MGGSHNGDKEVREALERVLADLPKLLKLFEKRVINLVGSFEEFQQVVAIAAVGGISNFLPGNDLEDSLRAYVFGIARNQYAAYLRKSYKLVERVQDEVVQQAVDDGLTPSRIMGKREGMELLHECMLKLTPQDRKILMMRHVENQPVRAVAECIGTSHGQMDRRIKELGRELRNCWGTTGAFAFVAGAPS